MDKIADKSAIQHLHRKGETPEQLLTTVGSVASSSQDAVFLVLQRLLQLLNVILDIDYLLTSILFLIGEHKEKRP